MLLYLRPHAVKAELFYFTTEIFCRRLMFEVAPPIGKLCSSEGEFQTTLSSSFEFEFELARTSYH